MSHHETMELADSKQTSWDKQREVMTKFYRQGAQEYLDGADDIDKAFETEKKCVCCMDEGTAHMDMPGKFELAGSGILYPAASWEERLDKVADLLIDMGIEEITSHDGCGAAGLACKRDGIQTDNPDEYGIKWAKELQQRIREKTLGISQVTYRHIPAKDMVRDAKYHEARVVWFDATGRFNPAALGKDAPLGFVIDYKHITERAADAKEAGYPFEELKVALTIAFGDHGFGKNFNEQNPFVVVVMAHDDLGLEILKFNIAEFIKGLNIAEETKKSIKIDGYSTENKKALEKVA